VEGILEREGFHGLLGGEPGPGYSEVRGLDYVALLNRLPGLRAEKTREAPGPMARRRR